MTHPSLSLSELSGLSRVEKQAKLRAFALSRFQSTNGELVSINDKIDDLERRHKMSSVDMLAALRNGALDETEEICHWLMALEVRKELLQANATQA